MSEWRDHAGCRGLPVDWFVHGCTGRAPVREWTARALSVCRACPVVNPCLLDAFQTRDLEAIRGGTTGRERRDALNRADGDQIVAYLELRKLDDSGI